MFNLNISFMLIGAIFSLPVEPTAESNKLTFNFAMSEFSGNESGFPITEPMNESHKKKYLSHIAPLKKELDSITALKFNE